MALITIYLYQAMETTVSALPNQDQEIVFSFRPYFAS